MYGYNRITESEQRAAMQALLDLGVATVTIEFSGGNDEGGTDGIDFFDTEGNKVESIPSGGASRDSEWDPIANKAVPKGWVVYGPYGEDGKWGRREATEEEVKFSQIAEVLEHPIYDRWGSFAGEFYVHGTLTWDVAAGTHRLSGQESHEVWDDFDE